MIAVIQAHKEGESLEFRKRHVRNAIWQDLHPICFGANFGDYDYRVKPEPPKPREWWVRSHKITGEPCLSCGLFENPEHANRSGGDGMITAAIIHVREVLDAPSVSNGNEFR